MGKGGEKAPDAPITAVGGELPWRRQQHSVDGSEGGEGHEDRDKEGPRTVQTVRKGLQAVKTYQHLRWIFNP